MAPITRQGSKSDAKKNTQSDEMLGRDSVPNPNPSANTVSSQVAVELWCCAELLLQLVVVI